MGVGNQKRWVGWMLAGLMIISTPVFADGAAKTPPLTTEAVVDHPEAMTVSDLPAPYAETIAALQASLAGHQEVIARVERAALALAKAGTSYDRADTALASADLALADAQAALASATEAAKEQEALLAQLKDMHALHEAYEKAEATYALVQSAEQKANDALDAADETLTSAHGLSEETSAQLAEKQAELLEMEDALEALRAKVKGPAQGEDASKLADDLKASETAYAAFADQVRQLEAEAARISGEVDQAVAAQAQADAEQRKAVEALEQASAALEQAKAALDTVQLTKEEILANEETAKAGLLKAQAVLDQAKADAEKAQAAQAEKQKLYQQAAQALEASQNEQQEADAAYAALQERWAAYADIPGAVTDQARFPAMDLVACAEAGAGIYTIHANGHDLYFFMDGVLESTQKTPGAGRTGGRYPDPRPERPGRAPFYRAGRQDPHAAAFGGRAGPVHGRLRHRPRQRYGSRHGRLSGRRLRPYHRGHAAGGGPGGSWPGGRDPLRDGAAVRKPRRTVSLAESPSTSGFQCAEAFRRILFIPLPADLRMHCRARLPLLW